MSDRGAARATLRIRRGIPLGRSALAVRVAAVGVVAIGVELAAAAFARGVPSDASPAAVAVAVGVFALAASLRPVELAEGEKYSLAAAAALFGALVLPGALAVASVTVAASAAMVARRRSIMSSAVNVAQIAGATGAASLANTVVGGALGIIAGAAIYATVMLALVGVMVTVSRGSAAGAALLWRDTVPAGALVAIGGIASVVWRYDPLILLLFVPLLATVEIGARRAAAERSAFAIRERAERAQRDFALDAAHELRTPLASVIGDLDFLADLALAPAEAAALAGASSEARRASGLVERLLLLARAGAETAPAPADAGEAARRVVARSGTGSGVPIELEVNGSPEVAVPTELLEALIGDVVENAKAYTREGRVRVAVRRSGPRVEVVVADTGVGIPADELPRIFDRFFRGSQARAMASGTGLGLAIVRRILETHAGDIAVESTSGQGTTVTVRLPAAT